MTNDVLESSLAGMLHDWGKLMQRAKTPLSPQGERMREHLCPHRKGQHTHLHVLWTNELLETHAGWLSPGLNRSRIQRLASQHHRPSQADEEIITRADRLANGHDRRLAEEEPEGFRNVPLYSIFRGLSLANTPSSPALAWKPGPACFDESMFPAAVTTGTSLQPEYASLAHAFLENLDRWPPLPATRVCDAVDGLSARYLARFPASTIDLPDVSLHDHSRLVAAFAGALQVAAADSAAAPTSDRSLLLVAGDLSGIQRYLFDLPGDSRRGQARAYRARSFYLAMLTRAAVVRILQALNLPGFNCVIDAGGRFVVLAANTPESQRILHSVRKQLDEWLLEHHAGQVTLNLGAGRDVEEAAFHGQRFPDVYSALAVTAETSKQRKLASVLQVGDGWDCSRQVLPYVHTKQRADEALAADVELGRILPRTRFVGLWPDNAPRGLLQYPREVLGFHLQCFERLPDTAELARAADFFAVTDGDDIPSWVPVRPVATYLPQLREDDVARLERRRADDRDIEADEEENPTPHQLATFTQLAHLSRRPDPRSGRLRGVPAIGCLKADVDRLGLLFSEGLGDLASFGRVATLSRDLDGFFKGYLPARLRETSGPYRLVYTVFAGGDDLLLIGPWTIMFELALDIRTWFHRFVADNPNVTLSAGLALGTARMPVSSLAAEAARQLDMAKNAGRNRIAALGEVFGWAGYGEALQLGKRLDELMLTGDNRTRLELTSGFVYRLLQYARMAGRVQQALDTGVSLADLHAELTWRSHLAYDIARNLRQRLGPHAGQAVRDDLDWLESLLTRELRTTHHQQVKLAATYALYRNRGG